MIVPQDICKDETGPAAGRRSGDRPLTFPGCPQSHAGVDWRGKERFNARRPMQTTIAPRFPHSGGQPGGRVLLFAHNDPVLKLEIPAATIGIEEKEVLGSYSASIDEQAESANFVFSRRPNTPILQYSISSNTAFPALRCRNLLTGRRWSNMFAALFLGNCNEDVFG